MKRCVIIGGAAMSIAMREYIKDGDYIIAADSGCLNARKLCVQPDLFVGDYDSVSVPKTDKELIKLPREKDDTDIMFAAREAVKRECTSVTILGGMGGRFDHTLANMSVLVFLQQNNVRALMADETNEITVMLEGEKELYPREDRFISLFPIGERAKGVTLKNLRYELENATITNSFPIGVSNEYRYVPASIKLDNGGLFIVHSLKD